MMILNNLTLDGASTVQVTTLGNATVNAGMRSVITAAAGNYQGEFVSLMRQAPRITFQTRKLDALTAPELLTATLFFRQVTAGGTVNSTWYSIASGEDLCLAIPRQIQWQGGGGPATLTGELIFLSTDGSTAPMTVGSTSGDSTAEAKTWSGNETGMLGCSIDFGFREALPEDGLLYPQDTTIFLAAQRPMLRKTMVSDALLTTANVNPGSIGALTAELAEMASGGVRGTTRTYSVTGQRYLQSVSSGQPATVEQVVMGTGGVSVS